MVTSFKRAYARGCVTQVAAPRAPAPEAGHCWPIPPQETQTQVWLSLCGVSGSWCAQGFVWALQASLVGTGLDCKHDFTPPTILLGLSFALGWGLSFLGRIQHSPVNGCSAASCDFGVLTGEDEHTSFYSAILPVIPSPCPPTPWSTVSLLLWNHRYPLGKRS